MRLDTVGGQPQLNQYDARTKVVEAGQVRDRELAREKRIQELREKQPGALTADRAAPVQSNEIIFYVASAFAIVLIVGFGSAYLILQYFGPA